MQHIRQKWVSGSRSAESTLAANAEAEPVVHVWPVTHSVGSAARLVRLLVSELPEPATSRNCTVPLPNGVRIASQYWVPAVRLTDGTLTAFQVPLAALVTSRYQKRRLIEPVLLAVKGKACAVPAGLLIQAR